MGQNKRCEPQHTTIATIDEQTFEHIVLFIIEDLPELETGKRYRVTLDPIPDTVATIPPAGWRDGE